MANDYTAIGGKIVATGLLALRAQAAMLRAVNIDFSDEAKSEGQTIDVPIPMDFGPAQTVTPGPTPVTPVPVVLGKKPVTLDRWIHQPFGMTDKEEAEVMKRANWMPMQASAAIESLVTTINADLFALYYKIYRAVGVAGTTPFPIGSGNFPTPIAEPADAGALLNDAKAPNSQRRMMLDTKAYAAAQKHPDLAQFERTGDQLVKVEGFVGRKYGYDWFYDQQVPKHTAGTITTGLIAKAATAVPVGTKSFIVTTAASTGALALKKGDLIGIAGQTNPFFAIQADVAQASAASDATLSIEPGLDVALVGSEAITRPAIGNTHRVNLAFHRSAFAFATRPLALSSFKGGNTIVTATDPETGVNLTLEISRQNKQVVWDFSILYAAAEVRNDLAVRIAG